MIACLSAPLRNITTTYHNVNKIYLSVASLLYWVSSNNQLSFYWQILWTRFFGRKYQSKWFVATFRSFASCTFVTTQIKIVLKQTLLDIKILLHMNKKLTDEYSIHFIPSSLMKSYEICSFSLIPYIT